MAVGRKRQRRDLPQMPAERGALLAGRRIPELERPVGRPGDDEALAGRVGDRGHRMAVPAKRRPLAARDHVPAPHRLRRSSAPRPVPCRRERTPDRKPPCAGHSDGGRVSFQDCLDLSGGRIPERRRSDPIPRGQDRAIGRECQTDDARAGSSERADRAIVGHVAERDDPVQIPFGQGLAVRRKSDGGDDPAGARDHPGPLGLPSRSRIMTRIIPADRGHRLAIGGERMAEAVCRRQTGKSRASPVSTSQVAIPPLFPAAVSACAVGGECQRVDRAAAIGPERPRKVSPLRSRRLHQRDKGGNDAHSEQRCRSRDDPPEGMTCHRVDLQVRDLRAHHAVPGSGLSAPGRQLTARQLRTRRLSASRWGIIPIRYAQTSCLGGHSR